MKRVSIFAMLSIAIFLVSFSTTRQNYHAPISTKDTTKPKLSPQEKAAIDQALLSLKQIDWDKINKEIRDAVAGINFEKIQADIETSLKNIQWDQIRKSIKDIPSKEMEQQIRESIQKAQQEVEKSRKQIEKIKKGELEKMQQEIERSRKELEQVKEELRKTDKSDVTFWDFHSATKSEKERPAFFMYI